MRTDYIKPEVFNLLLTALMPENRLALQLSLATGLRIGDCLSMRTAALEASQRPTIREQKTGKKRRIYVPKALRVELLKNAGKRYIFPGRLNPNKPRTRAAVYKDLKRVAALYRLDGRKNQAECCAAHRQKNLCCAGLSRAPQLAACAASFES